MPSLLTHGQRRLLRVLLWVALFVLANSAYLVFSQPSGEELSVFYQVMLLGHLAGGLVLLLLATAFLVWHLRNVKALWHQKAAATGTALGVAAFLLFITGLFILTEANSVRNAWAFWAHRMLAIGAPALYATHRLVSHFKPDLRTRRKAVLSITGTWLLFMLIHAVAKEPVNESGEDPTPFASKDRLFPFVAGNYPDPASPFFPSRATTSSGSYFPSRILGADERAPTERTRKDIQKLGFVANTSLGAETCRRCHPDVVAQWESSAHRFSSLNNPWYRASFDAFRERPGGKKASQWCGGCHDPAVMLPGSMPKELDTSLPESQAGLTCLSCHAIDEIHGRAGNGGYNIADQKPSPYLGDGAKSGPLREIADLLIKSKPAVHKRRMLKPFFRHSSFCLSCHKVSLDTPVNDYRYLRGQDEWDNWQNSGTAHGNAATFYLPKQPKSCQECHMPREAAPLGDVSAKGGTVASHRFFGPNDALPFLRGDFEHMERIRKFRKDAMRIDVFAMAHPEDPTKRVRALDLSRPVLLAGREAVFDVVVRNKGVGHTFPGGTTDSNEAWVELTVEDTAGTVLWRHGAIREDGHLDPAAHVYAVHMVREDGTRATKRDPHTFRFPAFARVIGPGSADQARYGWPVPASLVGHKVRIRARLLWRKFNRHYVEFVFRERGLKVPDLPHLKGKKIPDLPVTTLAESVVELEVAKEWREPKVVGDADAWVRFNDHGIANLRQDALDIAERSFGEVARLRPDLPDGYRNMARRWLVSGQPRKAEPYLRKVGEVAPRDPQRAFFWGWYFERTEEFAAAADAYEKSLRSHLFPEDRNAWRRLSEVRFKLHEYDESLTAALRVLEIDPENALAHKRRLDIHRIQGDDARAAEAAKAFEKYRKDDVMEAVANRYLQRNPEINKSAQPLHVYRD